MDLLEEALLAGTPPATYETWLGCFEVMRKRRLRPEELALLKTGVCRDYAGAAPFFGEQLVKTVNAMLRRGTDAFLKDFETCSVFHDYGGFDRLCTALKNQVRASLFFTDLGFLSEELRTQLRASVESEAARFWRSVERSVYLQCCDGNPVAEELYETIRKVKLFPDHKKKNV